MHLSQIGSTLRDVSGTEPVEQFIPFGRRLRALREALELTLREIKEAVGIGTTRWNNWEQGSRRIDYVDFERFSNWRHLDGAQDWVFNNNPSSLPYALAQKVLALMQTPPEPPGPRRGRPRKKPLVGKPNRTVRQKKQ